MNLHDLTDWLATTPEAALLTTVVILAAWLVVIHLAAAIRLFRRRPTPPTPLRITIVATDDDMWTYLDATAPGWQAHEIVKKLPLRGYVKRVTRAKRLLQGQYAAWVAAHGEPSSDDDAQYWASRGLTDYLSDELAKANERYAVLHAKYAQRFNWTPKDNGPPFHASMTVSASDGADGSVALMVGDKTASSPGDEADAIKILRGGYTVYDKRRMLEVIEQARHPRTVGCEWVTPGESRLLDAARRTPAHVATFDPLKCVWSRYNGKRLAHQREIGIGIERERQHRVVTADEAFGRTETVAMPDPNAMTPVRRKVYKGIALPTDDEMRQAVHDYTGEVYEPLYKVGDRVMSNGQCRTISAVHRKPARAILLDPVVLKTSETKYDLVGGGVRDEDEIYPAADDDEPAPKHTPTPSHTTTLPASVGIPYWVADKSREPKFKQGDRVRIKVGEFKGQQGRVALPGPWSGSIAVRPDADGITRYYEAPALDRVTWTPPPGPNGERFGCIGPLQAHWQRDDKWFSWPLADADQLDDDANWQTWLRAILDKHRDGYEVKP